MNELNNVFKAVKRLTQFAILLSFLFILTLMLKVKIIEWPSSVEKQVEIETLALGEEILPGEIGSLDKETGLIIDHGFTVVKTQCGACHSTKLVAQNKFDRKGWLKLIRWMQEEQNLWDLGEQEGLILDYLEKNCAPSKAGRRRKLENIDWYVLNE